MFNFSRGITYQKFFFYGRIPLNFIFSTVKQPCESTYDTVDKGEKGKGIYIFYVIKRRLQAA